MMRRAIALSLGENITEVCNFEGSHPKPGSVYIFNKWNIFFHLRYALYLARMLHYISSNFHSMFMKCLDSALIL